MKYEDKNSKNNQLENLKERKSIFLLVVSLFIFLMLLGAVSALTQTYSKNGDAFSSATGEYATNAHCIANNTCTWINGNQVILGVYSGGFNGGSATWTFNVTQPVSQITSAELQLSWPSVYGKGLHSVGGNTTSTITVGSSTIASPATSAAISCGNSDRYAFACYDAVPTYSIPISAISANTNVTISVPSNTLWDLGNVKLVINYSAPTVVCSTNAQCGTSDWVAGTNTCSNNNVYQNYKTYTCNNPGTTSSSCTSATTSMLKETCQNGCTNGVCNGAPAVCSTNSDCGIDGTIGMYPYYCSNNDRFAMYRTYTCNNPGTLSSSCTYNDGPKLIQDCGETHTDPWQTTCNAGMFIQTSQTTYNQGCVQEGGSAYCQFYTEDNVLPLIYCEKGCQNAACLNSACWLDSQCGTSGWVEGTTQCYLNNVYQNYKQSSCTNPGYANASCSNATELKLKETCAGGCSNGVCTANATGIKIENGKIKINGTEFLIKGVDYAPWLNLTGSDIVNRQEPFPQTRLMDVTAKVTSNGKVNVPDYSGDGKIQAWEVIKFDVLTMKKVGANTIRTYATAYWHDKDLDGVIDPPSTTNLNSNELKQGDLPDWAIEELLTQANANNMKVIMGYWVEEENFKETPFVANWDDLLVAKQALGVMMNKYKSNPAVLAWGIGNEVNGAFNQGWFSWGVNVNDYLNALFAHARTIDTTHPIIYAKYVGENANFNNLTADIISVNAFTFDVAGMKNNGEFSIPAPSGKAYMFGEFGHLIEQASEHWDESKKYAGGAFLEYNNVWWKGDGHNTFGIVDAFRAINTPRYSVLNDLFGGTTVIECSTNAQCGTDVTGANTCSGKQVVRTNTRYTCNNPGTQNAFCSSSNQTEVVQTCANTCTNGTCAAANCSRSLDCGTNSVINSICKSNKLYNVKRYFTCNNAGKTNSYCSSVDKELYSKTCTYGCLNAVCLPKPACRTNSNCGTNSTGKKICEGGNVVQASVVNTCLNPNTQAAVCDRQQTTTLVEACANGCNLGKCLPAPCGFNDGITVSAEAKAFSAWDISQVQLLVSYKSGTSTKTVTLTKNGNEISSGEGAYATLASCSGACSWLVGNQVIVGAYDSDPVGWGGKVYWNFDLSGIDSTKITRVIVKLYRPNTYGKGLHSPYKTGGGVVKLENMTLANLTTSVAKCGTDWFAKSCSTTTLSYTKTINSTVCILQ